MINDYRKNNNNRKIHFTRNKNNIVKDFINMGNKFNNNNKNNYLKTIIRN